MITGGQQDVFRIGGEQRATTELSGTFTIDVVPATHPPTPPPKAAVDSPQRKGPWKVKRSTRVFCLLSSSDSIGRAVKETRTTIVATDKKNSSLNGCTAILWDTEKKEIGRCTLDEDGRAFVVSELEDKVTSTTVIKENGPYVPYVSQRPVSNPLS